jgi:hypothetical protein
MKKSFMCSMLIMLATSTSMLAWDGPGTLVANGEAKCTTTVVPHPCSPSEPCHTRLSDLVRSCFGPDPCCTYVIYNASISDDGWLCDSPWFMGTFWMDCYLMSTGYCGENCANNNQGTNMWGTYCDETCNLDACWYCGWSRAGLAVQKGEQITSVGQFDAADYIDHTPDIKERRDINGRGMVGVFWAEANIDKDGNITSFELDKDYLKTAIDVDPELPKALTDALFTIKFKAIGSAYIIRVLLPIGVPGLTAETVKQRGIELRKEKGIKQ